MGFGTTLYTGIYFSHETYDNKRDICDKIYELKKLINECKEYMKMLAVCTEPKKFFEEDENLFWSIHNKIEEQFEQLEEYYTELYKLEILLDKWESCHDEKTGYGKIPDPNHNIRGKSFIWGDFMNGITPDGKVYDYKTEILK